MYADVCVYVYIDMYMYVSLFIIFFSPQLSIYSFLYLTLLFCVWVYKILAP